MLYSKRANRDDDRIGTNEGNRGGDGEGVKGERMRRMGGNVELRARHTYILCNFIGLHFV